MNPKKVPYAVVCLVFGAAIGGGLGILFGSMLGAVVETLLLLTAGTGALIGLMLGAVIDDLQKYGADKE